MLIPDKPAIAGKPVISGKPATDKTAVPEEHWTDHSICRGADPELFFPIGYSGPLAEQVGAAKAICANCPVIADCLDWALRAGEPDGIWGGTTPEERRYLRARRRAAA